MKMKFYLVFFLTLIFNLAHAELIETDLANNGDGMLIYDSDTGLEWIDLPQTYNLYGSEVQARISNGGIWEGFHHASREEVLTLWRNVGLPFGGVRSAIYYEPVVELLTLMGAGGRTRGVTSSILGQRGYVGSSLSTECYFDIFEQEEVCVGEAQMNSYYVRYSSYLNSASSDGGHWLVRTAVNPPPTGLVLANQIDVGSAEKIGTHTFDSSSGTYTLASGGINIGGWVDDLNFVYNEVEGNIDLRARVNSISENWATAGIMIRDSLDFGSAFAANLVANNNVGAYMTRLEEYTSAITTESSEMTVGSWIRLQKQGDIITSYTSHDGNTWSLIGSEIVPMAGTFFIGITGVTTELTPLTISMFDNISAE